MSSVLTILDLSLNSLTSITSLACFESLEQLNVSFNKLNHFSSFCKIIKGLKKLIVLDARFNSLNEGFYLEPVDQDWEKKDLSFSKSLNDATFVKRVCYRSAVLYACAALQVFDGHAISSKERKKSVKNVGLFKGISFSSSNDESLFRDWKPVSYPMEPVAQEEEGMILRVSTSAR